MTIVTAGSPGSTPRREGSTPGGTPRLGSGGLGAAAAGAEAAGGAPALPVANGLSAILRGTHGSHRWPHLDGLLAAVP